MRQQTAAGGDGAVVCTGEVGEAQGLRHTLAQAHALHPALSAVVVASGVLGGAVLYFTSRGSCYTSCEGIELAIMVCLARSATVQL